jgi:hypothetical protein
MIRRDYLLRMIEQCIQALTRSLQLSRQQQFDAARDEVDQAIARLAGIGLAQAATLPETELAALLLQGEPTQVLPQKTMLMVALLHRAGEILQAQTRSLESRACYLKALNLALDALIRHGTDEVPDFVPKVDILVGALEGEPLPIPTSLRLMQYYEQSGQFAKAEDVLFILRGLMPDSSELTLLATQFYDRLLRQSDEALELGNLPRAEVVAGRAELQKDHPS